MTTALELFNQADLILLDFDGPVTRLLPPPSNAELASRAKDACLTAGVTLSEEAARSTDHLSYIRAAGNHSASALAAVESTCTLGEVEAANTSPITAGVEALLRISVQQGKAVIVVTNNSPNCVEKFLALHALDKHVQMIIGRDPQRPERMKPDPHILLRALATPHRNAVMIGDSVSDIQAAKAVSVSSIGLSKNEERSKELQLAGATAVVTEMNRVYS